MSAIVCLLTHVWTRNIGHSFLRMRHQAGGTHDVYVVVDSTNSLHIAKWEHFLDAHGMSDRLLSFDLNACCTRLGITPFEKGALVPGSPHIPILDIASRATPEYIWAIEYDVVFSGNWMTLFSACLTSDSDLIASHIESYSESNSDWHWWTSLSFRNQPFSQAGRMRAFLPIYRLSLRSVDLLIQANRNGYNGHFEALVPTILAQHDFSLSSFNDLGQLYKVGTHDFSLHGSSSMRPKPEISPLEYWRCQTRNILWHPVKRPFPTHGFPALIAFFLYVILNFFPLAIRRAQTLLGKKAWNV